MKNCVTQMSVASEQLELDRRQLLQRLRAILGDDRMPNDTPAAEAVLVALLADAEVAGESVESIRNVPDAELIAVGFSLSGAMERASGVPFTLPFGTEARTPIPGSIKIGSRYYVLDAGKPGLHAFETVPRGAQGANFDRLKSLIARKTRNLACRVLGAPMAVEVREKEPRPLIRFGPLAAASNVVLERSADDVGSDAFCAALPIQIEKFADSIVADMRFLWKHRTEIGARVDNLRLSAQAGIRAEPGLEQHARVRAIVIDLNMQHQNPVGLFIEYEALDDALRDGTILDFVPGRIDLSSQVWSPPHRISGRVGMRGRLAEVGATGWIDGMAEAIARSIPGGVAGLLSPLATAYETTVFMKGKVSPIPVSMFWDEGSIGAEFDMAEYGWANHRLEIRNGSFPETVLTALPGRRLSELVELPFEFEGKITEVHQRGDLQVYTGFSEKLINLTSGAIWAVSKTEAERLRFG